MTADAPAITYGSERELPKLETKDGFPCLTFPALSACEGVSHLISTRLGGVSEGIFSTLNLSFTRGDRSDHVHENYRRVAKALGVSVEDMVFTDQTHTTNVRAVTKEDRGRGVIRRPVWHDVDGLVTNEPGVCLCAFFADCVPLLFVDTKNRAIGLSHSGWRGTAKRMGEKTVQVMREEFGTDPADLIAAIGPSIGQCCYEVSEDVIVCFREAFSEQFHDELFYKKENGRYQLDLRRACEITLIESGIPKGQISVSDLCTCCNPDLLFSHRASGGKRGNFAAFLTMK